MGVDDVPDNVDRMRRLEAMRAGVAVIYQATLRDGVLAGYADFLRRVDGEASTLGPWRYEVADTKLKRRPHPKHVLQLVLYSDLLTEIQGVAPEFAAGATTRWSLGPLTLPHELARIIVLEQWYRAWTILRGEPYHK